MAEARVLTAGEVQELAVRIDGRRANVFATAEEMFGFDPGDAVFDQLAAMGYGKCAECDVWQPFERAYLEDNDTPVCDECEDN